MEAIRETGDHFAGRGLVLWNEFEEYAKYFARAAKISVPFEALTPQQVQLRRPTYFYGHYFDLDEELLSFVEGYPIIVTRRSPVGEPPARQLQARLRERVLPRLAPHCRTRWCSPSAVAAALQSLGQPVRVRGAARRSSRKASARHAADRGRAA